MMAPLPPVRLSKTKFTFSHAGWTAGMECKSYNQEDWAILKQAAER